MIREFFCSRSQRIRLASVCGLVVFLFDSMYRAQFKLWMANWYAEFYDTAASASSNLTAVDAAQLHELSGEITRQLFDFAFAVIPLLLLEPTCSWVRSNWVFLWRRCLISEYYSRWNGSAMAVEGAAQRIHEDTMRFAAGVQTCFSRLTDAAVTLCAFVPSLVQMGSQVRPEWAFGDSWMLSVALAGSIGGFLVSAAVSQPLVRLEMNNQAVEAALRTELVLCETQHGGGHVRIEEILVDLRLNYKRLYASFFAVDVWLSFYRQAFVLLPYVLLSPLLFADAKSSRITVGTLMKACSIFETVFGSLSVVANSWGDINVWRSTIRRLLEFERHLSSRTAGLHCADNAPGTGLEAFDAETAKRSECTSTHT